MKDADGGAAWSWGCFCFSGKHWWNVAPNVLSVNFQRATKKGGSEPHSWCEEGMQGGREEILVGLYQQTGYDTMLIQKGDANRITSRKQFHSIPLSSNNFISPNRGDYGYEQAVICRKTHVTQENQTDTPRRLDVE